jgi:hypothetical protein
LRSSLARLVQIKPPSRARETACTRSRTRLFVLLAQRPVSEKDTLAGLAGARVTLTGALVERDGMRGLQVKSVERAPVP